MNTKLTTRRRLLASTIICGALAASFGSTAMAQTAPASGAAEVEEIVVTGSLFARKDLNTPSPVTIMTEKSIKAAGITTATDAIRSVSADGAGTISTAFAGGFSAGGAAVSLRNLGVSSTLILVDGLRSTNFPINDDGHNAYVDLNSIPFGLIDRVEVLKDGASSSYGADAIGGVVNLILKKQFQGVSGSIEGGAAQKKDAEHTRGDITYGFGDYAANGFNFFVNLEYQRDGRVSNNSRGFPFNTNDLSSIGGLDNNTADSNLATATPNAVVVRTTQSDLNNPLTGGLNPLDSSYVSLNLACPNGTYTVTTGAAQGTGCKYDLSNQYNQIVPLQKRKAISGRFSVRFNDSVEGYAVASYSRDFVSIKGTPRAIRATQPFGGPPSVATSIPGVVLPVYICTSGINCATPGAAGRRLNPNNPFAAAYANDPTNGAARIYYLFGDIPAGSDRTNEVMRVATGLFGNFGDGFKWKVDAVGARDNIDITTFGYPNNAALLNAINTGSYNFVNPSLNSQAVRDTVAPAIRTPSHSSMVSLDGSISKALMPLGGGDLQLAIGGQIRKEVLVNNSANPRLDVNGLNTAAAFGEHTVKAVFFEIDAPVLEQVDINVSGRYDDYSEGFSHFSPKVGIRYEPIKQIAVRGTYSKGFRAPTFAESGARSAYPGFSTYTPSTQFQNQHGGAASGNPYAIAYSIGSGSRGNPDLKPETSRSFTLGLVAQPTPWLSATVDYYNIKKSDLIVAGPLTGAARTAYYAQTNETAGCAAVAAVGPGYSCELLDAPDPLFPNAMRRVLLINQPFVNSDYMLSTGFDFSATARTPVPFVDGLRLTSNLQATKIQKSDLHTSAGVQRYAGTLGPNALSSGNGTPRWRGSWQNSFEYGKFTVTATTYWTGRIKSIAQDNRAGDDCTTANQYATGNTVIGQKFCYVKRFIYTDLNGAYQINDNFRVYANVGNVFNDRAPIAPGAYSTNPNYLAQFHYAGLIGRTYKIGVGFDF